MNEAKIRWIDLFAAIAAQVLMGRGQAPRRPPGNTETYEQWARRHVASELWNETMEEVRRMSPEQRRDVISTYEGGDVIGANEGQPTKA